MGSLNDNLQIFPIAQGIHADILLLVHKSNLTSAVEDNQPLFRVVKCVAAPSSGLLASRRPHNVRLEANILSSLSHPNIVELLGYQYDINHFEHQLTLPYLPLTLSSFNLHCHFHSDGQSTRTWVTWIHIAKGLMNGLAYLHGKGIGHRDVKPGNIMFDSKGKVILIDFGTAWVGSMAGIEKGKEEGKAGHGNKEEHGDKAEKVENGKDMCCQVGTGPYRAPELLFSPTTYSASALDLWSSGVTLAELFLPFPCKKNSGDDDYEKLDGDPLDDSHVCREGDKELRGTLFSSHFGDIGLAGSIFNVLGSPTSSNWPSFTSLPDAGKIEFTFQPSSDLSASLPLLSLLPNNQQKAILTVLDGLIQLEPSRRMSADEAGRHLASFELEVDEDFRSWKSIVLPQIAQAKRCVEWMIQRANPRGL